MYRRLGTVRARRAVVVRTHDPQRHRVSGRDDLGRGAVRCGRRRQMVVAASWWRDRASSTCNSRADSTSRSADVPTAASKRSPTTSDSSHARDGVAGYQLWAGGSLGAAPRLSLMLRPFVARASSACGVDDHGMVLPRGRTRPGSTRGRLKFAIETSGDRRSERLRQGLRRAARRTAPGPPRSWCPTAHARDRTLAEAPTLGWRNGIGPERRAGYASITVRVPLGDLLADELEEIGRVAPTGRLDADREQNI